MSGVEGLSHITLTVGDLDRMEAILTSVLEARKVYESGVRKHSIAHERFYLIGCDQPVWVAIMRGTEVLPRGYNHVAFKIADGDLEARLASIRKLGLEVRPPRPRIAGEARSIYFYDEDNHLFELHTGTLAERLAAYAELTKE